MGVGFLKQVVHEHDVSSAGGHLAFGELDERVEHNLRSSVAQLFEGQTNLLGLEFVIFAQDIDEFDQDNFNELKLDTLLTPGRNNGVHSMLKKVKTYANNFNNFINAT